MRNLNRQKAQPALFRGLWILLMGLAAVMTAGCGSERDAADGQLFNSVVLPTDPVLGLFCADVGLAGSTCVLDDPENPFASTTIIEFIDFENPGNKFQIADTIPVGPTGAKARFYFWATALANRQSGENQYYTALALHEVFNANSNPFEQDELIRQHALDAYRSLLDNFFGGVTVFKCFECGLDDSYDPPRFPQFAKPLNTLVADHLYRRASTTDASGGDYPDGLMMLIEGTTINVLDLLVQWEYAYQPCTDVPECTNGVITKAEF